MYKEHYWPLDRPRSEIEFSETCPECGAEFERLDNDLPHYKCGGYYYPMDQIQNHHDRIVGSCPVMKQKRLNNEPLMGKRPSIYLIHEDGRRIFIATASNDYQAKKIAKMACEGGPHAHGYIQGKVSGTEWCGPTAVPEKGERYVWQTGTKPNGERYAQAVQVAILHRHPTNGPLVWQEVTYPEEGVFAIRNHGRVLDTPPENDPYRLLAEDEK